MKKHWLNKTYFNPKFHNIMSNLHNTYIKFKIRLNIQIIIKNLVSFLLFTGLNIRYNYYSLITYLSLLFRKKNC